MELKKKCPREGVIWLTHKDGTFIPMPTACRTWKCPPCRNSLISYTKMRMETGCSTRPPSYFITLTNRMLTNRPPVDAEYVKETWARFCRLCRLHPRLKSMKWFRVIELTKKGQPHLHLLMNGIGVWPQICRRPNWNLDRWLSNVCSCLLHLISRLWHKATKGDTWVTDAREVRSPRGIARYLSKYLVKAFDQRSQMENLGFSRRYNSSARWGGERRRMVGTLRDEWTKIQTIPDFRLKGPDDYITGHPAQESYADADSEIIYRRRKRASLLAKKYGVAD